MAAPTPTARGTPSGRMLKDGYRCLITFASNPTIEFWEKSVTPPGFDGGDKIDITTMHNNDYRTFAARALITLTESSFTAAYDPAVLTAIESLINRRDTVTIRFSDGSTWAFYGFLKSFAPQEVSEGEQPTAQCSIEPINMDSSDIEQGPTVVSVSGT